MSSASSPSRHIPLPLTLLDPLRRRPWIRHGIRLSGAVISILVTFSFSNLRVIPTLAPAYDAVWAYLVPLAIPFLLLRANLRRILKEAGPTLLAFIAGSVGTLLGTLLAVRVLPLGPHGYQLAGIFCATYIGGSMNYVGTAEALGLRKGDLLSAGIAADNLMMMIYFLIHLFSHPLCPTVVGTPPGPFFPPPRGWLGP